MGVAVAPETIRAESYGLKDQILSPLETLAQSIANIAPTATPTVVIPLVFALSGNGTWLAYLIATVAMLFVASNINHFARRSASPGSLYTYIATGLGPSWGVLAGWSLVIAYIGCASAVTSGFANYANVFLLATVGFELPPVLLIALSVALSWLVAYKDIQLSARLMLVLELSSVSLILLLVAITLVRFGFRLDLSQITLEGVTPTSLRLGLVLAMFSFVGFESATALGTEARNPLRNIPRAVVLSAVIVGSLFVIATYAEVIGFTGSSETLGASSAPLHVLAERGGAPFLGLLVDLGAVVSLFACTLASINAGARVLFLMGRHGIFHASVGGAHDTNETPHIAVTISTVLAFLPAAFLALRGVAMFDIYGWVGTVCTLGFLVAYVIVSVAAPVYLRRRGELRLHHVAVAALAVGLLVLAIAGNLYPVPPAPLNWLPYLYFGLLLSGAVWLMVLRYFAPNVIIRIQDDVAAIRERFSDGGGI